ncbi:MAG: hypothetical protein ACYTBJ_06580 [Planctomycetota bacterium]
MYSSLVEVKRLTAEFNGACAGMIADETELTLQQNKAWLGILEPAGMPAK